jgi:hypothetical protein
MPQEGYTVRVAKRPVARIVLVLGFLLAIAAAALVVLLPRFIKAKLVSTAAAHGVALTIDDLSIRPGRAQIKGVKASPLIRSDAKGAPKASASAAVVDVDLDGFTPTAVTVSGMTAIVDGDLSDVMDAIAKRDKTGDGVASIEKVTIKDAELQWKHMLKADLVVLDAKHVDGVVTKKDFHAESKELRLFDKKDLAPWGVQLDGDTQNAHLKIAFPGTAKASIDLGPGTRQIDVDTPNVGPKDLGMPPEVLGLYGDETSKLEIHLHHKESAPDHAEGTFVGAATNVFLGASTARTSFTLDMHYAGDPKTSLKITAGTLKAGPFTGALEGGFAVDPNAGFKVNVRYSSGIMTCVDAVKSQAASYGEVGKGVAALANMLGLDKEVQGRILLKGEIELDSRTNARRFAFHTEGDCKLSYLPSL